TYVGPEQNLLDETPQHANRLELEHPLLSNSQMEKIRHIARGLFKSQTIPLLFNPFMHHDMRNRLEEICSEAVDAVKSGAIKKFFVMAGCDGRMKSREYYTEFAQKLPKDTVIMTAGCAKYRYNKLNLGDIGGIPRVLDAGQCNDSYSLAVIALKLKEVFGLDDINKLPIAYNISWYEQKAVIVLLALLYLGVKNIHLGPTLPAFLSPNVVKVLVEKFGIAGIGTVDDDIKLFMA
ncbi:MAG: glutamate synthase central domain-containing protein, partial [Sedimentibacter sp.]|uniref:glutamate synthase central domain-containing protein n=1 Tax=Sedimentibacter sp. TaxID=1960295 RepID=UPI0029815125